MTVLFYLNNVTGGGETVFPVADNRTYDEMVRAMGRPITLGLVGPRESVSTPFQAWEEGTSGCRPPSQLWLPGHAVNGWQSKNIVTLLSTESDSG